jgi:hypothetical protein
MMYLDIAFRKKCIVFENPPGFGLAVHLSSFLAAVQGQTTEDTELTSVAISALKWTRIYNQAGHDKFVKQY